MKNKKTIFLVVTLFVLPLFTNIVFSQALPPPVPPTPPTGVPFGAVEFLLSALGIYAAKKMRREKK